MENKVIILPADEFQTIQRLSDLYRDEFPEKTKQSLPRPTAAASLFAKHIKLTFGNWLIPMAALLLFIGLIGLTNDSVTTKHEVFTKLVILEQTSNRFRETEILFREIERNHQLIEAQLNLLKDMERQISFQEEHIKLQQQTIKTKRR